MTATNEILEYTEQNDNEGLSNFFDWIHDKYEEGPCLGQRKVLGHKDGIHQGKKVKKVSQEGEYQRLTHSEVRRMAIAVARGLVQRFGINLNKYA